MVRDAKAALIALAIEKAKGAITSAIPAKEAIGVIGVIGVVIDAAAREKTDVDPARRVIDAIGRTKWKELLVPLGVDSSDADTIDRVVTSAFQVASSCGSSGGCSWERLTAIAETLVSDPNLLAKHREALVGLASKLVASFVRGPDRTPRDMLVSAVGALAAILDLATSGQFMVTAQSTLADHKEELRNVLSILQAISAGDIQSAMAGFASFLRAALPSLSDSALLRVGAVVGTFVGFAQADDSQPKTAEERAARREAQIAAVEGLVDFLASRNEVKGAEVIISLGGSLRWGRSFSGAASEGERGRPGLTLGLGLDYTFNPTFGLHADISLVNLGNYLEPRTEDAPKASWSDLFEIGGTISLFVYPKFPVYLGFNANYASHRDAVDYGLIVGVWVPLWDFL
ncbi:MAG: hypothetical protein JNJ59_11670 [Deltaproteobacteria bacterium]|nr:hypothetical protein [Deltaproteobacteria bacterium]